MSLLAAIERGWSWKGLYPVEVIDDSSFGNLLVKDRAGHYWRICPEELDCVVVASTAEELRTLTASEAFRDDWGMSDLLETARSVCGPLGPGQRYCLKMPAIIGGRYESENLGVISLVELAEVSGDMARQIKDVPHGGRVQLAVS